MSSRKNSGHQLSLGLDGECMALSIQREGSSADVDGASRVCCVLCAPKCIPQVCIPRAAMVCMGVHGLGEKVGRHVQGASEAWRRAFMSGRETGARGGNERTRGHYSRLAMSGSAGQVAASGTWAQGRLVTALSWAI
jgi:hypothetical protein